MVKRLWFFVFIACLLTSCGEQKIVNRIKLVQTIGLDNVDNGVKSTVFIGSYKKKGEADIQLLDTVSPIFDIWPTLNTKTKDPIGFGQLGMVLIGKDYSKNGIKPILETLSQNPRISSQVQLGVADQTASEVLGKVRKSNDPFYLSDLIDHHMTAGNLPLSNLHITLSNFFGEGRDMFFPHFGQDNGDIHVDGLALFKGDKYITKISLSEAFLLKMLLQTTKQGFYLASVPGSNSPEEDQILLSSARSHVTYSLIQLKPVPSIGINLDMNVNIKHYPPQLDINTKENIDKLEDVLGAYFENEVKRLLSFFQKNNVDPAGLGDFIRARSKDWNESAFQETYPNLETKVKVKLTINEFPIIH